MTHTAARYDLRYLEGCLSSADMNEETWDLAVAANNEPRPQAGSLHTFTLTGLESGKNYCVAVKSLDAKGHVSLMSNIIAPLLSDMNTSGLSGLVYSTILRKGYNLISLPLLPVPNGRDTLFGPVVGWPVSLYRWYSAYPGITEPQYYSENAVQPGFGYLLYSPADNISLSVSGVRVESEPSYSVNLQGGWNMIGLPYSEPILLQNIQVKNNAGNLKSYSEAVKAGWIGNAVYHMKGANYDFASFNDDPPASLEPWAGYWIYVGEANGVEIIFNK